MQFGGLIKRKVVLDGSAIRILPILLLWQKSTVFLNNTISNFYLVYNFLPNNASVL